MKRILAILFLILVPASLLASYKIIGYLRTWEMDSGRFWTANDIAGDKMTDINLAFGLIRNNRKIYIKGYENGFVTLFDELKTLKRNYPNLKINLSIGGWGAGGFSDMAHYEENRKAFVANVIKWLEKYNFDGVDIDWEYPVDGGGGIIKSRPEDKRNFTKLMSDLRAALTMLSGKTGKEYTLSFAAGASEEYLGWIEPAELAKLVDFVNLMTYDFYGPWTDTTGHQSNLYVSASNPGGIGANKAVNLFIKAGFSPEQIILGVPFYGRGWEGVPDVNHGLYQSYRRAVYEDGLGYDDIVKLIELKNLRRYWDDKAKAPFLYNGDLWLSYDDPESLKIKAKYIRERKLGGVMFWEYTQDLKNELLNALYKNLTGKKPEKVTLRPERPVRK